MDPDPDPEGPETGGSGSGTLAKPYKYVLWCPPFLSSALSCRPPPPPGLWIVPHQSSSPSHTDQSPAQDIKGKVPVAIFLLFFIFLEGIFIFFALYSALLHLPPLRFHCADGCGDRTQTRCNWCIGSQTL